MQLKWVRRALRLVRRRLALVDTGGQGQRRRRRRGEQEQRDEREETRGAWHDGEKKEKKRKRKNCRIGSGGQNPGGGGVARGCACGRSKGPLGRCFASSSLVATIESQEVVRPYTDTSQLVFRFAIYIRHFVLGVPLPPPLPLGPGPSMHRHTHSGGGIAYRGRRGGRRGEGYASPALAGKTGKGANTFRARSPPSPPFFFFFAPPSTLTQPHPRLPPPPLFHLFFYYHLLHIFSNPPPPLSPSRRRPDHLGMAGDASPPPFFRVSPSPKISPSLSAP